MKRALLLIPFLASVSFGAVSVNTQWEIRATATAGNVNGCGFVAGASGTDYSQQDAAQWNLTGVTSAGAGNVILSTWAATAMVGNLAHVISGTNFTAGWYEITSVVAGTSITLGTNKAEGSVTTGAGSLGVVNIGGACSLNSTLDDDLFESATGYNGFGANTFWIKAGSYTLGETVSISASAVGATRAPIEIVGYNTNHRDFPEGTNRPTISVGASLQFVFANDWQAENLIFTGQNTSNVTYGFTRFVNCKFVNNSATTARAALSAQSNAPLTCINCEAVSLRGTAISGSGGGGGMLLFTGGHIHHSPIGYQASGTGQSAIITNSLFSNIISTSVNMTGAHTIADYYINNTFYGRENQATAAIAYAASSTRFGAFLGNLFYGYNTPISISETQSQSFARRNAFNNFTNYSLNISTAMNNYEINPQFRNVIQRTGSTATTTSGNHLVQTGATFQTWGITTDDYMCLLSGTGVTSSVCYTIASIDSEEQITTGETLTADATADKVWEITQYREFVPGANTRNKGFPIEFYGSGTSNYADVGAVQHSDVTKATAQ